MTDLDTEDFRRMGHLLIDWVADHRAGLESRRVRPVVRPGQVRAQLRPLSDAGAHDVSCDLIELLDEVVVPGSLLWQHPGFFGYFPAQASLASLLGDIASSALGSQGMLWATSPAATELEQALLDDLGVALGLPETFTFAGGGGGVIQDSASSATLVALLAALHRNLPGWRARGVSGVPRVYATAETHSSLLKAARVAGLGDEAVVVVPGRQGSLAMDDVALRRQIDTDLAAGRVPVLVCATVGTTSTGACDDLTALSASSQHAWVHVDAAWAGVASVCPEHRALLDGIGGCDSFVTDAHKWCGTAFDASMLWVRDAGALPAALSVNPEYLRNAASESGAVVDYRDWQVPLGRRARALKLWAHLHSRGLDGLREDVRSHCAWTRELCDVLLGSGRFSLAAPISLALGCFYALDARGAIDDALGASIVEEVNASGRFFLTHTSVGGHYTIRVAVGALLTRQRHVEALGSMLTATHAGILGE